MNKERRKELARISSELETLFDGISDLLNALESVKEGEQEAFDNLSEGFQNSERGERMQASIDALDEATSCIDTDEMRAALDSIATASE